MKNIIAVMLAFCLILGMGTVLAESVEEQLAQIVTEAMEQNELVYEYDAENEWFTLTFTLDSVLGDVETTIFLYDDMVSVSVESPITIDDSVYEKLAIFTALANNEIYYGQFRLDRENGTLSCRSCNVIEEVLPSYLEIETLLYMPLTYMDRFGDGIAAICLDGADPYDAFDACQAAYNA